MRWLYLDNFKTIYHLHYPEAALSEHKVYNCLTRLLTSWFLCTVLPGDVCTIDSDNSHKVCNYYYFYFYFSNQKLQIMYCLSWKMKQLINRSLSFYDKWVSMIEERIKNLSIYSKILHKNTEENAINLWWLIIWNKKIVQEYMTSFNLV